MEELIKELVTYSISKNLPDKAVKEGLKKLPPCKGRRILIAFGKAAYQMGSCAVNSGIKFDDGVLITKYGYLKGPLPPIKTFEAGHPILDENSILATEAALDLTENLGPKDQVVVLISGGGSALFEAPLVSYETLAEINSELLSKGADIVEINTIRKRLSKVKGGKFAKHCRPAQVYNIILSDVLGNRPDMIASGPTYPDFSTSQEALAIKEKYDLKVSEEICELLKKETVKDLPGLHTTVSGSVDKLCKAGRKFLKAQGYEAQILTTCLNCEAREAGSFLGSIGANFAKSDKKLAFIFGGETVVHLKGCGKGGRNQELALAAAKNIRGLKNVRVISFGSDGTDGPTDAAGAYSDGFTMEKLEKSGLSLDKILADNNSYPALKKIDQLIFTGPTGTNVNDMALVLIN